MALRRRDFQQGLLATLKAQSFAELSSRLPREAVQPPRELKDWKFAIIRSAGEVGGVLLTVEARRRSLLIFESIYTPHFEMLPDGTIIEPEVVIDD